jgi:hypothetical protein
MFIGYRNDGNGSYDLYGYVSAYNAIGLGVEPSYKMEVGYVVLMKLGNLISVDFYAFKSILVIFSFLLITKAISRYTKNYNCVFFLYMLYPIVADTERFRNFLALSIFVFAIKYLEEASIKNKVKYTIFILLASTIHQTMCVYLLFLFANTSKKKSLTKLIVLATFILCVITLLNNNNIPFLELLLQTVSSDEKMYIYLSSKTNYGFLIPFLLHAMSFMLVYHSRRMIINFNNIDTEVTKPSINLNINEKEPILSKKNISYLNLIYWINTIAFIFYPLYMVTLVFNRFVSNLLLLNFIVCAMALDLIPKKNIARYVLITYTSLILIIWSYSDFFLITVPDQVLKPFFEENILFK